MVLKSREMTSLRHLGVVGWTRSSKVGSSRQLGVGSNYVVDDVTVDCEERLAHQLLNTFHRQRRMQFQLRIVVHRFSGLSVRSLLCAHSRAHLFEVPHKLALCVFSLHLRKELLRSLEPRTLLVRGLLFHRFVSLHAGFIRDQEHDADSRSRVGPSCSLQC